MMLRKWLITGASVVLGLGLVTGAAQAVPAGESRLSFVALESLPGQTYVIAKDINDRGVAVGASFVDNARWHAVWWDPAGRVHDLPEPDTMGNGAFAELINNRGTIVGYHGQFSVNRAARWDTSGAMAELDAPNDTHTTASALNESDETAGSYMHRSTGRTAAARWDRAGHLTYLGTLPGALDSYATDINDAGVVVGGVNMPDGTSRAVRWDRGGQIYELAALPGQLLASAKSVNNAGTVIGYATTTDDGVHAVTWDRFGRITDLPLLPDIVGIPAVQANDINATGTIIGLVSVLGGLSPRGARWDRNGRITELQTLPGMDWSYPVAVNEAGVVVGWSMRDIEQSAVIWDRTGRVTRLPGPPYGSSVSAINNAGTILGVNGDHAVLWR